MLRLNGLLWADLNGVDLALAGRTALLVWSGLDQKMPRPAEEAFLRIESLKPWLHANVGEGRVATHHEL